MKPNNNLEPVGRLLKLSDDSLWRTRCGERVPGSKRAIAATCLKLRGVKRPMRYAVRPPSMAWSRRRQHEQGRV